MDAQRAFGFYFGLHLHFTTDAYSVLKYGTNTKSVLSKFDKLGPEHRYRFRWLSEKFPATQDLVYACIAAEFADISIRFGTKEEILDAFYEFKRRRESLTYTLEGDTERYHAAHEPTMHKLLFRHWAGEYSPEFLLLVDHFDPQLATLRTQNNMSFAHQKILKIIKYRDFFNVNRYAPILTDQAAAATAS